ncbi:hypothetical protein ABTK62_20545, partial [Acinetobacter baumannii]
SSLICPRRHSNRLFWNAGAKLHGSQREDQDCGKQAQKRWSCRHRVHAAADDGGPGDGGLPPERQDLYRQDVE